MLFFCYFLRYRYTNDFQKIFTIKHIFCLNHFAATRLLCRLCPYRVDNAMKAFAISERIFVALNLCAAPAATGPIVKIGHVFIGLVVFMLLKTAAISSILFIIEFLGTDLESILFAVLQTAATLSSIDLMISIYIKRDKVAALITEYQKIYDKSTRRLILANRKIILFPNVFLFFFFQAKTPNRFNISLKHTKPVNKSQVFSSNTLRAATFLDPRPSV